MKRLRRFYFKKKDDKIKKLFLEQAEISDEVIEYNENDIHKSSDNKKQYIKVNAATLFFGAAFLIIVSVFLSFFVADRLFYGGYFIEKSNKVSFDKNTADFEKVAKFQDIINLIRKKYYLEYDENKLIEGAIKGLVEALGDPYSNYISPGSMDDYNDYISGSYQGIGVEIKKHEKGILISAVFEDSPASKAGLKASDIITHINGESVNNMSDEKRSSFFGTEGNVLEISVLSSDGKTKELSITVETIKKQTVFTDLYENNISYIRIDQFDSDTGDEFEKAVNKIMKENSKGLIIDLRNNGGGLESQASIVADIILPEGLIAYSQDKNGDRVREIKSNKSQINIPIVMLINQNTASASELVAGAFRDFDKGLLIGVKSFGKALGQQSKTYENDGSGIVLTIARYFTPKGECIHGVGIKPDIEVILPDEYKDESPDNIPFEDDLQLEVAIEEISKLI